MNKLSIKVGDSVRVIDGFFDEQTDHDLGGWQGRVQEIYEERGSALIHFDSITIEQMPSAYIQICEEDGCSWTEYGFGFEDLEIAEPRDRKSDVKKVEQAREGEFRYAHLGIEGRDIDQVLKDVAPDDLMGQFQAWENYLSENLTFPFVAEVEGMTRSRQVREGARVKVRGLDDIDDQYGIIAKVQLGRRILHHPLSDLEVVKTSSPNHDPLQTYALWFTHR